ncbi:MAG: ATP-binding protein [Candidatus Shapirobacteria bacterium]
MIAVASGKGGTGKTTVAAHLALACSRSHKTLLVDLDVEAPDVIGYFQKATLLEEAEPVSVRIPSLLPDRCTGCGLCAKSCRFGAIVALGGVVSISRELCKGCGRCVSVCPVSALDEINMTVGRTSSFLAGVLPILEGRMDVGDIRSTAVIEAAKRRAASINEVIQIRDCPPGVSCPATHSIEGADYVILVAEPTEFSLHDLGAAIKLTKSRGIPTGVVINKDGFGSADIAGFCAEKAVPVIGRIAFLRSRAESGASAALWNNDLPFMNEMDKIVATVLDEVSRRALA